MIFYGKRGNYFQAFVVWRFIASCGHGNQIQKESGGGGSGAAGRVEGRAGAGGKDDVGATQGRRPQGGGGPLVKKV